MDTETEISTTEEGCVDDSTGLSREGGDFLIEPDLFDRGRDVSAWDEWMKARGIGSNAGRGISMGKESA